MTPQQPAPEGVSDERLAELILIASRSAFRPSAMFEVERALRELQQRRSGQEWRTIESAPRDVEILLGWWDTWPSLSWKSAVELAGSTKGGWLHGHATHWQPLPPAPAAEKADITPTLNHGIKS